MFNNKTILLTGGTGSFGNAFTKYVLTNFTPKKLIIFSRDENKQYDMQKKFNHNKLRFFLGDVRDKERLVMAMRDVDYVIHAAAQKHVPIAEYNPIECVKTNINGAQNIITASIQCKVKKVIALSTDKATNPINLYGATKLAAEKLFLSAHTLVGRQNTKFSVVRYGNVINSRGSVIPFFKDLVSKKKPLTVTDINMTRFFINLEDSVKFVIKAMHMMYRSEIFIPKMYSLKILDLAKIIGPKSKIIITGIRSGEKLHELLCSADESHNVLEEKDLFVVFQNETGMKKYKEITKGKFKTTSPGFFYSSDKNSQLLKLTEISKKLKIS
jgi:UDP-N-acetylglucosamine 4,6-dehydratase